VVRIIMPVRGIGRVRIPHRTDDPMRLLNYVLKSVGFVAELISVDTKRHRIRS
jgi:hypothetical protein